MKAKLFSACVLTLALAPMSHADVVWSNWLDRDNAGGAGDGENLSGFSESQVGCKAPVAIDAKTRSGQHYQQTLEALIVSPTYGLVCKNEWQSDKYCEDYMVRFGCESGIDWQFLIGDWHEDHNTGNFVPTSVDLGVARYRQVIRFASGGQLSIRRLASNDAHYYVNGSWSRSGDQVTMTYFDSKTNQSFNNTIKITELSSTKLTFDELNCSPSCF